MFGPCVPPWMSHTSEGRGPIIFILPSKYWRPYSAHVVYLHFAIGINYSWWGFPKAFHSALPVIAVRFCHSWNFEWAMEEIHQVKVNRRCIRITHFQKVYKNASNTINIFDHCDFLLHTAHSNNSKAPIKYIKGDICEKDQLNAAFSEATAVIHSAAYVRVTTSPDTETIQRVNVQGRYWFHE